MSGGRFTPPRPIHLLFQSNVNNIAYYEALFRVSVSLRHRLHLHKHGTPVHASFVGVMLLQFGIRHLINFDMLRTTFPHALGMDSETALIVMICIEVICSLCIMVGFLTRLSLIPPLVAMVIAECHILNVLMPDTNIYTISSTQPGYLPLMFIGIYLFLALAGPGKISLDYFISLYIVSTRGKDDTQTEELEEV